MLKNERNAGVVGSLDDVLREVGPTLHGMMSDFLNKYIQGSDIHGQVYTRTLDHMRRNGCYSAPTVAFYQHCYNGAEAVKVLNQAIDKK